MLTHIHRLLWQKGVREEFQEKGDELADRDGGDVSTATGIPHHQSQLCRVIGFLLYRLSECLNVPSHAGRGMIL